MVAVRGSRMSLLKLPIIHSEEPSFVKVKLLYFETFCQHLVSSLRMTAFLLFFFLFSKILSSQQKINGMTPVRREGVDEERGGGGELTRWIY